MSKIERSEIDEAESHLRRRDIALALLAPLVVLAVVLMLLVAIGFTP